MNQETIKSLQPTYKAAVAAVVATLSSKDRVSDATLLILKQIAPNMFTCLQWLANFWSKPTPTIPVVPDRPVTGETPEARGAWIESQLVGAGGDLPFFIRAWDNYKLYCKSEPEKIDALKVLAQTIADTEFYVGKLLAEYNDLFSTPPGIPGAGKLPCLAKLDEILELLRESK